MLDLDSPVGGWFLCGRVTEWAILRDHRNITLKKNQVVTPGSSRPVSRQRGSHGDSGGSPSRLRQPSRLERKCDAGVHKRVVPRDSFRRPARPRSNRIRLVRERRVPEVTGRAHVTGLHEFLVDPDDPLRAGGPFALTELTGLRGARLRRRLRTRRPPGSREPSQLCRVPRHELGSTYPRPRPGP